MGSQSSSSGWFKQAEQLEQERKSGSIAPPSPRVPPRPAHKPLLPVPTPIPAPAPVATPAEVEDAAVPDAPPAAAPPPLPNPMTPRTLHRMQRSGPVSHAFHRPLPAPPAKLERSGVLAAPPARTPVADPNPTPRPLAAPAPGRFSLVPEGEYHRLVFARPGTSPGVAPQILGRLSVAELRQLRAALDRYLGAVDPDGTAGGDALPAPPQ